MTREQAINSMISHGFKVEQVGEIIKAVTPQFSSELEKNSKKLEKPQTFKWCTDCKEYDQEKHCCHRWSKVIRDTVEEMKQEPKTGHWKPFDLTFGRSIYYCTVCDVITNIPTSMGEPLYKYCPNCGARMAETEAEDGNVDN